jgi:hypothetical protein
MSAEENRGRRNPLRRTSDRIEACTTFLMIMTMLLVAPWAAWSVTRHTYRDGVRMTAWERQHRIQVPAVLLEDVSRPAGTTTADDSRLQSVSAPARWVGPDGAPRTGTIVTGPDRRAGTTQLIWVDAQGAVAPAPGWRNPAANAFLSGLLLVVALAGGLAGIRRIVVWRLDRRRMRAWQAEWLIIEPRWSHR